MYGGTRSYEMAKRLVAKGHHVNMVTSWREDDGRQGWFETEEAGIHVHWLPVPYSNNMDYKERIGAFLRFAWSAAHRSSSLPADLIFASSTPLTIALPGAYAAWRQKVPMVFEVRDLWPDLPIAVGALRNPILKHCARWLERFAYKSSAHIVALSPGMRDGMVKRGFPEEKIKVIPNSADLDLFDPKQCDDQAFRMAHPELGANPIIIYAGTLGKINGVAYLPQIAASAQRLDLPIQFAVVGRGMEEEMVHREAQRLGVLYKNFHMYPAVSKNKMPDVYAAADVALSLFIDLEPMWSNSANKFFDALAAAKPVAINYAGWQAELLGETGAGIVLPPNEPHKAACVLAEFCGNKDALQKAGRAARRLAEERFSRDKSADQLEQVLFSAEKKFRNAQSVQEL